MIDDIKTDTTRYMLHHADRGAWLGNGWWSNDPEGKSVNSIPTYTLADLAMRRGAAGIYSYQFPDHADPSQGVELRSVSVAVIDQPHWRLSEKAAVDHELVAAPWTDKGLV